MADFTPSLRHRVEEFVRQPEYRPMKQHELARAMGVRTQRAGLRQVLRDLEREGLLIRLRKNRWAPPNASQHVSGVLRAHPHGFAFVISDEPGEPDVYIPSDALGVALHGDRVLASVVRLPPSRRKGRGDPFSEDRLEGRILRVVERFNTTVVGLLKKTPYYAYVIPDNPKFLQDVRIREEKGAPEPVEDHKVVVALDDWPSPFRPLTGTLIEDLGVADAPGTDMLSLMRAHHLAERFPAETEAAAAVHSPTLPDELLKGRKDCRGVVTFTIDPKDARDFDDAVSLERTPDGGMVLGVHIADVAHYVPRDSDIDREAYVRATSVYLVDRVITMLPRYLTTEVCSLVAEEDRLTHSVLVQLTPDGEVVSSETASSVIRSRARLHYDQVQTVLDGGDDRAIDPEVKEVLRRLHPLTRLLRERRIHEGSVDLAMPEVRCELDEKGQVSAIHKRAATEAYQLIEECMLLANQVVARKIEASERPGLYRVHDEPNEGQWGQMAVELAAVGVDATPHTRADINAVARRVRGTATAYSAQLAMLKNFKRAEYVAERREHFGLAFTHYTHFTSPIRRYPDLVTHRILRAIEDGAPSPYAPDELASIGRHASMMEREADEAEKESVEIKRLDYYRRKLWSGQVGPYAGWIVGMSPKGLFVELEDSLQRGMVPFRSFPGDYYRANATRTEARSRRSRAVWSVGQRVEVTVTRVDCNRRFVDFQMVTPAGRR